VRLLSLVLAAVLGGLAAAILIGGAAALSDSTGLLALLPAPASLIAVLLPAAGVAALLKERAPPEVGVIIWAGLVVLGAPLWIDRGEALGAVGLGRLDAHLPAVLRPTTAAPQPSPGETLLKTLPPPPIDHAADDLVVLPYEGTARSMLLTVSLESERVVLDTEMVFDTGATLTTISPRLLEGLEIDIPDDAPTIQLQTANGVRTSPLLLLDRLWLGGFAVEGVSVSVCDNCGDLNGLIGLNVSSMFRVEVDQQARELTFHPEDGDRHLDIAHWLSMSLTRSRQGLSVTATNRSTRTISGALIEASCGEPSVVRLETIAPGQAASATFPEEVACRRPDLSLLEALW